MAPHPDEGMLHAFIDGELSAGEATALEAHVAECGLCGAALAEARGFVAGASRAISALDTAPSSASRRVAARPAMTSPASSGSRPFIFRVPFARAAALLLLAGGSAVVINRSTSDGGATSSEQSLTADETLTEERASSAPPVQAAPNPTTNSASALAAPTVGRDLSARGAGGGVGAASQKQVITPAAPTKAMPIAARIPLPARMAASAEMDLSSALPAPRVTRYRTRDGVTLTLTEEPLRTSFAEESTAARRSGTRPVQTSAPAVNTYRWSSAEQDKSFTLTGSLSVAELEAASKRLSELERVP